MCWESGLKKSIRMQVLKDRLPDESLIPSTPGPGLCLPPPEIAPLLKVIKGKKHVGEERTSRLQTVMER